MTATTLEDSLDRWLLREEGGYSNDPDDAGGETMYGITIAEARAYGYMGPMRDMPMSVAVAIFKDKYWSRMQLGLILDADIVDQILQAVINQGVDRWEKYIQTICNLFLLEAEQLVVDGVVGSLTVNAINKIIEEGLRAELSQAIHDRQVERYDECVSLRPEDMKYYRDWHRRADNFLIKAA